MFQVMCYKPLLNISTVTSAQARPVIVPPVVPPVVPPPPLDVPPQTITLSTALPDREVSAVNSVEVESGAVHFSDCVNTTHTGTCISHRFGFSFYFILSSVVRAFAHGAMGRRIDPSWGAPIELFLIPACAPRLV